MNPRRISTTPWFSRPVALLWTVPSILYSSCIFSDLAEVVRLELTQRFLTVRISNPLPCHSAILPEIGGEGRTRTYVSKLSEFTVRSRCRLSTSPLIGCYGWLRTCILPVNSRALYQLSYVAIKLVQRTGIEPGSPGLQPGALAI